MRARRDEAAHRGEAVKKLGSIFWCDILLDTDDQRIADRAQKFLQRLLALANERVEFSSEAERYPLLDQFVPCRGRRRHPIGPLPGSFRTAAELPAGNRLASVAGRRVFALRGLSPQPRGR